MSKMELSLASASPRLLAMQAANQHVEVWQISLAEAETAFRLVEEYYQAMGVVAREDRRKFGEEYCGEGRGFWLARVGCQLAGCVALRKLPFTNEKLSMPCAEIKRMYVRENFRGRGIAQQLLEAAEKFARDAGYSWIYLDTTDDMKAAARLYERSGYVRCDRYNENPQATIFMQKKINRSRLNSAG
jgi:GNAT superfamily N-acetyltransferase